MSLFNAKFSNVPLTINCKNLNLDGSAVTITSEVWEDENTPIDISGKQKAIVTLTDNGGAWNITADTSIRILLGTSIATSSGGIPNNILIPSIIEQSEQLVIGVYEYVASSSQVSLFVRNVDPAVAYTGATLSFSYAIL